MGASDPGQDGSDDVISERDHASDGASSVVGDVVAAGPSWLVDEVFGSKLAEVVGALADVVVMGVLSGHGPDLVAELAGGEPVGGRSKRKDTSEGATDALVVEIEPADTTGADLRWLGELVEDPVG